MRPTCPSSTRGSAGLGEGRWFVYSVTRTEGAQATSITE